MIPLLLLGAFVLGGCMVFGYSSFMVGFLLVVGGLLGLLVFMATPGAIRRPGETRTVLEERHYIGGRDDEHEYHHRR
ncbi:hypothetical protein G3I40_03220 [Streptomyces sp. SID14478]|uniref:hypothetical protein n=1 Tax=Streptomyces sp. SID14478 TaxID=2706073 RepID=UPI0013DB6B24|nr:hypothetical protein [Streptomyces sp. SID14478]NEB74256.1 hypothetical protein [Streptomyces sp. SID14478]